MLAEEPEEIRNFKKQQRWNSINKLLLANAARYFEEERTKHLEIQYAMAECGIDKKMLANSGQNFE